MRCCHWLPGRLMDYLSFYLAAWLVRGFHVTGFLSALVAAFVFSIVSSLLSLLIGTER